MAKPTKRIAAISAAVFAYVVVVGISGTVSPVFALVVALIPPAAYGVYRGYPRSIKDLVLSLSGYGVTLGAFRTNSRKEDLMAATALAESMGLGVKVFLEDGVPDTWYTVIITGKRDTHTVASLENVMKTVIATLKAKGYLVRKVDKRTSSGLVVGLLDESGVYPSLALHGDDNFYATFKLILKESRNPIFLSASQRHISDVTSFTSPFPPLLRPGYNFGLGLETGLVQETLLNAATRAFDFTTESAQALGLVLQDVKKLDSGLDPLAVGGVLQAKLATMKLSGRTADQLKLFADTLTSGEVMGAITGHSPLNVVPGVNRPVVIDLSSLPQRTREFIFILVVNWLNQFTKADLLIDSDGLDHQSVLEAMDSNREGNTWVISAPYSGAEEFASRAQRVLVTTQSDVVYEIMKKWKFRAEHIRLIQNDPTRAHILIRPLNIVAVEYDGEPTPAPRNAGSNLEDLVDKSAQPLSAKFVKRSMLEATFSGDVLKAVIASIKYLQGYGTVEAETFIQALGLGRDSEAVFTKLIRLGYLKKFVKAGIPFVELTQRGEEELDLLRDRRQG